MYTLRPSWARVSGVLVAIMLATSPLSPAIAYADSSPDKSETVHVELDAEGAVTSINVEDLLANTQGAQTLSDRSTLHDITPHEDEQTFDDAGNGSITWAAGGTSVQYEGASNEEPPVKIKVSYTLDGSPVDPAKLAGATGHLKLRIDYENTVSSLQMVGDEQRTIFTPFLCMTAAMLDSDVFSNVKAVNAKVIEDKGGIAVVGYAVPGLRESLDIDPDDFDLDLPDYLEIEADVADLVLDPLYTIVTPELFGDLDTSDLDFDGFGEGGDELQDAMSKLIDGSGELTNALNKLADGNKKLGGGAQALKEALGALPTDMDKLKTGADTLAEKLGEAQGVAEQLAEGAGGLSEAAAGAKQLVDGASAQVGSAAAAVSELDAAVGTLDLDDAKAAITDASEAADAAHSATDAAKALVDSASGANEAQVGEAVSGIEAARRQLDDVASVLDTEGLELTDEQREALSQALSAKVDAALNALDEARGKVESVSTNPPVGLDEKAAALEEASERLAADKKQIVGSVKDVKAVSEGASNALGELGAASQALGGASNLLESVTTGASGLSAGMDGVAAGLDAAAQGTKTLATGIGKVAGETPKAIDGMGELAKGIDQVTAGISATADGSGKLTEGLSTFNDEGIAKIVDAFEDLDDDVNGLTDRLNALRDAAKHYDNFAGKADGQSGSVRFIYKTEQIG